MLRRLVLYSVLIAAVAGFLLLRRPPGPAPAAAPAQTYPTLRESVERREREAPRLLPDARFLAAIGEVEHIVTGAPGERASCTFEEGGWTLHAGDRRVGRVGEFPGGPELIAMLADWARALGAPESLAASDRDVAPGTAAARRRGHAAVEGALGALHAVRAADIADRMWMAGHRDPATARLGARALVWMAAECFDPAGAGEGVSVRALAWTAVATACDSIANRREVVLLAEVLGYPADAVVLAERLPSDDPIRLAAARRDDVLDAIASRGFSTGGARVAEARWLSLRRAVERRDLEAWRVAADRGLDADTVLSLPLLASQLALGRFETDVAAGLSLLLAVASDLHLNDLASAPIAAVEERTLAADAELFETLLDAMPESADGAFLDRGVLRAWYRAAFYSSLFGIGEHLRTAYSSTEATQAFAASLGDGAQGPEPAREFARWYGNLAALKRGAGRRAAMKADLAGLQHFGAELRFHTWQAIRDEASWADPFRRECARYLVKRLDTRPAHLGAWSEIQRADLYDIVEGERLSEAEAAASHPRDLATRGWWAAYRGDRRTLDRLLADRSAPAAEMSALVRSLRVMTPGDSLRLDAVSERLVGENPDDWTIVGEYARALARRHRNERVRQLCASWLDRPDRSARALEDVDARNRMARACLEDGRFEEGWQAIRSVVGSWQSEAMSLAAEMLDRRGESAKAETLAMMAWHRYPDGEQVQSLVVDLFWRHGQPDVAARMLRDAPNPLSENGWQFTLGPRYARLQRERPKDAVRALDAMLGLGLGSWTRVGLLAPALAVAGLEKEAAELTKRLEPPGRMEAESAIATYRYLRNALGKDAALAWLAKLPTPADPRQATLLHLDAYRDHVAEALWHLPITTNAIGHAEFLWLLRAAAAVRDTVGTPEQLAELRTYYAAPGDEPYRHFGRMLLGLEPVEEVLGLRLEPRAESEACYYVGLVHQSRGEIGNAARWFARCVDIGMRNNGEHHWAMGQLYDWVAGNRSIERLEEETRGRSPVTT